VSEDSLLEQVAAAAEERQLSQNSLIVYRRTWLKIIAWAAAEGLILETFPVSGEFLKRRPAARRSSGVDAAVPGAHQPVWPICTRPRSSFIPGGCVIRNQISSEQDGQKRLVELLRAERLPSKRVAYWVISQLPLCCPQSGSPMPIAENGLPVGVIAESVPNRTLSGSRKARSRISQRPKPLL
jgi:hypothetical protein